MPNVECVESFILVVIPTVHDVFDIDLRQYFYVISREMVTVLPCPPDKLLCPGRILIALPTR